MLLNTCKDIALAVKTGKTKYNKGMMANEHITVGSNSYEKIKTLKYLDSLLTDQNPIHEEIKYRLRAGNSCY